MPKHKKTLKQKILADKRRETHNEFLYSFSTDTPKNQSKHSVAPVKQVTTITISTYDYLASDLRKTAVFTGSIVLIELALKFLIK